MSILRPTPRRHLLLHLLWMSLVVPGCAARQPDAARLPVEGLTGHVATAATGFWFTPCGSPDSVRMWVTFVDAAVGQAEDARKAGLLAEGRRTFVRWRASRTDERLVGPGGPALLVRDIFEIRAARADDCADQNPCPVESPPTERWGEGGRMDTNADRSPAASAAGRTLREYFAPEPDGVDEAGVRLVPIETPRGTFRVWTKRFGRNPRIRLLLLHGGPGATHEYFEALERFLGAEGVEFIYYDQLGSAFSDQPDDDSLWTVERFVHEVELVRQALGLTNADFYLLGHSWGGILAAEYALAHQQHLKGLVISNMMMSISDYNRYAENVLAKGMDPAVVREVKDLEREGQHDHPRYMELLMPNFYAKHICRLDPWPDAVLRTFAGINKQVYVLMQGPSEFGLSGRLASWDRRADLEKITVPTLSIGATHDTMDPEHMRWIATQVKHGSFLLCPNGSHMAMWDDQRTYADGLIRFLNAVDAGRTRID